MQQFNIFKKRASVNTQWLYIKYDLTAGRGEFNFTGNLKVKCNMRKKSIMLITVLITMLFCSCNNQGNTKNIHNAENRILQQEDGSVLLKLVEAARYCDASNPSSNTAEWDIEISKPGRYSVWLTSATKDTMNLKYVNPVRICLSDTLLEVKPVGDNIMEDSVDVPSSYFRADSYLGSLLFPKPGEYKIQIISEKVVTDYSSANNIPQTYDTMLMSVHLTPMTL